MTPGEYAKQHQKAFRAAFDFLTSHFPPMPGKEYWEQAAKDITEVSVLAGEGKLVNRLLAAVYDYLEDEWKIRRDQNDKTED